MVFVTVGTHEQQFNRLLEEVDKIKGKGKIEEDVVIQTGYSSYKPLNCKWYKLVSYTQMQEYMKNARIIITHGGPASFIQALQLKKVPIVVPRQKRFGEHVNDHQLEFCIKIEKKLGNIIVVEDIRKLEKYIISYDDILKKNVVENISNNINFNKNLDKIVSDMFK